jgi:hypothetical protein
MRKTLAACLILGVMGIGFAPGARAADPYWQTHHQVQWQPRTAFPEPEHQQPAWLREHCIKDYDGHEMCRR